MRKARSEPHRSRNHRANAELPSPSTAAAIGRWSRPADDGAAPRTARYCQADNLAQRPARGRVMLACRESTVSLTNWDTFVEHGR